MELKVRIPFGVRLGSRYKVRTIDLVHELLAKLAEFKVPVVCVDENNNIHIVRVEKYEQKQHYLKLDSKINCRELVLLVEVHEPTLKELFERTETTF